MKYFIEVAIFIAIIWGSTPFLTKYILNRIHYKSLIFIQSIITILISAGFCYYNRSEIIDDFKHGIDYSTVYAMILLAICVFFVNILFYMLIIDHETYLVSSITSIYPLITLFLSYLFLKEEITTIKILGIFLIVFGIMSIVK